VSPKPPLPENRHRVAAWGFGLSLAVQVVLLVLGVWYIVVAHDVATALAVLGAWCVIGSGYVLAVWGTLAMASRWAESDQPPLALELGTASRVIAVLGAGLSSAVGAAAAVQHIFFLDPGSTQNTLLLSLVGIWAMLLAWALLHWGFTQMYLQLFYRSDDDPLHFPGTPVPGILEFAYFAYTVAVSFAASDVEVRDRQMRWRVMIHSVVAFLFNALIIVTAVSALNEIGSLP
jgi:uncharacterized membrane protein